MHRNRITPGIPLLRAEDITLTEEKMKSRRALWGEREEELRRSYLAMRLFDLSTPNLADSPPLPRERAPSLKDVLRESGEDASRVVEHLRRLARDYPSEARVQEAFAMVVQLSKSERTRRYARPTGERRLRELTIESFAKPLNAALVALHFLNPIRERIPNFRYHYGVSVGGYSPGERVQLNPVAEEVDDLPTLGEYVAGASREEARNLLLQVVLAYAQAYRECGLTLNSLRNSSVRVRAPLESPRRITYELDEEKITLVAQSVALLCDFENARVPVPVSEEFVERVTAYARDAPRSLDAGSGHFFTGAWVGQSNSLHDLVHLALIWASAVGDEREAVWALRPFFGASPPSRERRQRWLDNADLDIPNVEVDPYLYARALMSSDEFRTAQLGEGDVRIPAHRLPFPEGARLVEEISPVVAERAQRAGREVPLLPRASVTRATEFGKLLIKIAGEYAELSRWLRQYGTPEAPAGENDPAHLAHMEGAVRGVLFLVSAEMEVGPMSEASRRRGAVPAFALCEQLVRDYLEAQRRVERDSI